jgi:hypothetical protein
MSSKLHARLSADCGSRSVPDAYTVIGPVLSSRTERAGYGYRVEHDEYSLFYSSAVVRPAEELFSAMGERRGRDPGDQDGCPRPLPASPWRSLRSASRRFPRPPQIGCRPAPGTGMDNRPRCGRVRRLARAERAADGVGLLVLLVALLLAQAWYSSLTTSRMLDEELAESVRNPVWVSHRLVYDGLSSNVGWYALIAATWQVFGFSLIAGKVIRVAFQALSLICLAHLLVRWLGCRRALLPLAVIGSSPVMLYFNTLATTYGVDLQWAPVVLWLLWHTGGPSTGLDPCSCVSWGFRHDRRADGWSAFSAVVRRLRRPIEEQWQPCGRSRSGQRRRLPRLFLLVIAWLDNAGMWFHNR